MDLALNNLQRLICHKTQQTKPNHLLLAAQNSYNIMRANCLKQQETTRRIKAIESYEVTAKKKLSTQTNLLIGMIRWEK